MDLCAETELSVVPPSQLAQVWFTLHVS